MKRARATKTASASTPAITIPEMNPALSTVDVLRALTGAAGALADAFGALTGAIGEIGEVFPSAMPS
jgi:hypothetical protein